MRQDHLNAVTTYKYPVRKAGLELPKGTPLKYTQCGHRILSHSCIVLWLVLFTNAEQSTVSTP